MIQKINQFYTEIGPYAKVTVDPISKARIVSFPFEFPDGSDGLVILCKVKDVDWKPSKEIANININFKTNENNPIKV